MGIFSYFPMKMEYFRAEMPYFARESRPKPGFSVGKYGSMPIPTGQRRKLKKYKRRTR